MRDRGVDGPTLIRYFNGECAPAEAAAIAAWIATSAERESWVASLRATWEQTGVMGNVGLEDQSGAWQKLQARIATRTDAAVRNRGRTGRAWALRQQSSEPGSSHRRWRIWPGGVGSGARPSIVWRVAGIAAAMGLVAFSTLIARRTGWFAPAQQFREFASASGSRTTVTLRDGTQLMLAPDTRLRVPSDFGVRTRMVELTGEASFSVVHDAQRPFAVRTRRALVRDVGTTFVVRTYPDDATDRVAVQEGLVTLWVCASDGVVRAADRCQADGRAAALRPGDLATVTDTALAVVHGTSVAMLTAWMQDGLVFENTPFRDVVRDVARAYGIEVTVSDSTLLARRVTAHFSHDALESVLDGVTLAVGARYERTARLVIIRREIRGAGERRSAPRPPVTTTTSRTSKRTG